MIQTSINIQVIEASDGMTLTNGETYSKKVYLGSLDSVENWQEIPDSEVPEEMGEQTAADTTSKDEYADVGKILMGELL